MLEPVLHWLTTSHKFGARVGAKNVSILEKKKKKKKSPLSDGQGCVDNQPTWKTTVQRS